MATLTTGDVRQSSVVPRLSSDESAEFGDFLRRARERRGLTLQQIARETKIPFRHLDALEHGNLSVVPQGIYRRAEIRAFAQSVGLDQSIALAELERALRSAQSRHQAQPSALRRPGGQWNRVLAIAAALALSSLAASALSLWTRGISPPIEPQSSERVETAAIASPASPADTPPPAELAAAGQAPQASQAVPAIEEPVAAVPPVEYGELTIVTEPAGARVTINGMGRGTTPLTVTRMPFGQHRIRVTLDGYVGQERATQLDAARPNANVQISLQAIPQ
jgi:cytoskeletal protein RodZ